MAKKAKKVKQAKKVAGSGTGCCTLRGSGRDEQHEGLTREQCRVLANRLGKNFSWVAGRCAEPG